MELKMFHLQLSIVYVLLARTAIGISYTLGNLNAQIQAELAELEESHFLVKALENLDAPYNTVNTLGLTIQINAENPLLNFKIMENCNFALKHLKVNYANIINVNQPKPQREILNVWIADGSTSFLKIFSYAEANTRNEPGIYLIILYQANVSSYLKKVKHIFEQMFKINALNVLVMLKAKGQEHIIYGYNPFSSDNCRKIRPFIVQTFSNKSLINNGLWPHDIKNFQKCPMTLYTWNIPPLMIFNNKEKGNNILGGIEGKILSVIARRLNFTIHLLTDNMHFYGDIDENGIATGPFFLLQKGFVDILMGSYFNSATRTKLLSETRTYMGTKLVAVVNKISSASTYAEWIFDPFTKHAWLFIIIYIIKVFGLISLLTPKAERSNTFLNSIATCLGVSQRLSDTRSKYCFAIMIWSFGFLIIRNAYQAKIYDAYRIPPISSPPESLDELVAQNYKIYSSRLYNDSASNIKAHLIGLATDKLVLEMLENDDDHHSAGIVTYARLLFYILSKNKNNVYDIVRQPLHMQQLCAYFQQHSYLTRPFDSLIAKMQSSGLLQKWSKDERGQGWDMPFSETEILADLPQPMTIHKFKWLFLIISLLHILAICVFLLEIWGTCRWKN